MLIGPLNKFKLYLKQTSHIFFQENAIENVVCEMALTFQRSQYVKTVIFIEMKLTFIETTASYSNHRKRYRLRTSGVFHYLTKVWKLSFFASMFVSFAGCIWFINQIKSINIFRASFCNVETNLADTKPIILWENQFNKTAAEDLAFDHQ